MLRPGLMLGGRFRILHSSTAGAGSIGFAEDALTGAPVWLVLLALDVDAAVLASALEREARFAIGVPGLARPIASGVDGNAAFVAYAAPAQPSVAEIAGTPWPLARVAALANRIATALTPLHEQGIAHGLVRAELVSESEPGSDVLFGFGVAALATRFGAAGEASQLLEPEARAPELRAALIAPTPASDLFALAVLLRHLLIGAENPGEKSLSPELEAFFASALAAEPRARLRDVRAFAAELTRLAEIERSALPPLPESAPLPGNVGPLPEPANAWRPVDIPLPVPHGADVPPPPLPQPSPFMPRREQMPKSSNSTAWFVLFAVATGFVLLFGGAIAGTVYSMRHYFMAARTAAKHAPVPVIPPAPAPTRELVPGPSDDPPLAPTASSKPPPVSKAPIAHAPLVPPGVGPSSFPEEARAALPVLGSEPIWGTRNAPLTWVLFGDLECPHTRRLWRALEAAKVTFGDDLRVVFRHRPLHEHPYALQAARVLAGFAKERGVAAFFRVLHRISQNEDGLNDERLLAAFDAAGYSGLTIAALEAAGESDVAADLALAGQFAVRSTPFSFVNGLRVEGERTPEEIERQLLAERRAATWMLAGGTPTKALYVTRTSGNLIGVGDQEAARVCVPIGSSPVRGPADALVTLVEFSDFECPFCKRAEPTLKTLLSRYPRTLRLVWKNYPLPQHKHARLFANFAADAAARGANAGFWSVHDGFFTREGDLFTQAGDVDESVLGELAGKAGLDGALLLIAARAGTHDAAIHADLALGERLGVNGTPIFFANGRRIQGARALDEFDAIIRAELASAERIVARGVAKAKLYDLVCDGD